MLRRTLLLALVGTLAACAHGKVDPDNPAPIPVRIVVVSHFAIPVEIYAAAAGINQRLGTVHPGMTGRFVVPQTVAASGSAEFLVRPVASTEQYRSAQFLLAPGSTVDLEVSATLFNSTTNIRVQH